MRDVILWALGGLFAFLATAGAFLLLANLGDDAAAGDPIPRAEPSGSPSGTSGSGPVLVLGLHKDRLEGLERRPGQRLALDVENGGDEDLRGVEVSLDVFSGNTARPGGRSYEQTVGRLSPGEDTSVEFEIDLSPPSPAGAANPGPEGQTREILEVRASTPEGASAVKTAVLAP